MTSAAEAAKTLSMKSIIFPCRIPPCHKITTTILIRLLREGHSTRPAALTRIQRRVLLLLVEGSELRAKGLRKLMTTSWHSRPLPCLYLLPRDLKWLESGPWEIK
jgi:hypothetical protein